MSDKVYSVSQLAAEAKAILEGRFGHVIVEGEISNLSRPTSGHVYFTLKDDRAQIRCALFRFQAMRLKAKLAEGQTVQVTGRVSLFEPRGDFQLIAETVEPAGLGALYRAFEALKTKLSEQGLFEPVYKKPLPLFPSRIAVVTSPTGAAVRDVLSVLKRRFPIAEVTVIPTIVQGEAAVPSLLAALDLVERDGNYDVLLLVRGGGSIEDLWAFNDETLARRIFALQTPVISGVGHETDFTIADLVADVRAPTPSAAAELATPDQAPLRKRLNHWEQSLQRSMMAQLQAGAQRTDRLAAELRHRGPTVRIQRLRQQLRHDERQMVYILRHALATKHTLLQRAESRLKQHSPISWLKNARMGFTHLQARLLTIGPALIEQRQHKLQRLSLTHAKRQIKQRLQLNRQGILRREKALSQAMGARFNRQREQLARHVAVMQAFSPLQTLSRGYCLTRDTQGTLIKNVDQLHPGSQITLTMRDGEADCRVEQTRLAEEQL